MRWVVIVLLMCNGIFFLWNRYLYAPASAAVAEGAGSHAYVEAPERLILLSERKSGAVGKESTASPSRGDTSAAAAASAPVEGGAVAPLAATDGVIATSPPDDRPAVCWLFGPFRDEVSGKQVVARLAAMDVRVELREFEIPGEPDYWVHLPPAPSRTLAIKALRELQAKRIDSFLIAEGELTNGISLGFFTQEKLARKVHEERRKQGYAAEIKVVPRNTLERWAVLDAEQGPLTDALWTTISAGNQGLERRKNYCDRIAPQSDID